MRTEIQQDENKQEIIQREAHQRSEGKRTNQIHLEDNIAGFLCYLAGIITGILFFIVETGQLFRTFFRLAIDHGFDFHQCSRHHHYNH